MHTDYPLIKRIVHCITALSFLSAPSTGFSLDQISGFLSAPTGNPALDIPAELPFLTGIRVDRINPLHFDFVLNKGATAASGKQIKADAGRCIRYFLASLTVPEKDLWVNLSPYEKNRIIPDILGQTEMGQDLRIRPVNPGYGLNIV
jgi:hypothetical protein